MKTLHKILVGIFALSFIFIGVQNAGAFIYNPTVTVSGSVGGTVAGGTQGSVLFVSGGLLAQDNTNFFWDNTNKQLQIDGVTGFSATTNTPLTLGGNKNTYYQVYLQNASNGTSASSDYIAGADNDGVALTGHYIDVGVNGSGWTAGANPTFNGQLANEEYVTGSGGNLNIGTDSSLIKFFQGGFTASNKVATLSSTALVLSSGVNLTGASGITSSSPSAGIGYATGAGCAVTQGTNRTTTVVCTGDSGAITLISAAGSATPASFTVTDTSVAATDTIRVNEKSGTDLYEIFVTAVGSGSFRITSFTTGGTTTEQPVFNFSVIKGVTS